MKSTIRFIITLSALCSVVILIGFIFVDQLFSKPEIHQGVIIEKVKVEKNKVTPVTVPYRGFRSVGGGSMTIKGTDYTQWIALVESDEHEVLRVHCTSQHFDQKEKGDTILFKKYSGHLLEVEYLSHSEEDTVQSDWDKTIRH